MPGIGSADVIFDPSGSACAAIAADIASAPTRANPRIRTLHPLQSRPADNARHQLFRPARDLREEIFVKRATLLSAVGICPQSHSDFTRARRNAREPRNASFIP